MIEHSRGEYPGFFCSARRRTKKGLEISQVVWFNSFTVAGKMTAQCRGEAYMLGSDLVIYEEEFKQIDGELQRLLAQANAKVVFLVDKNGQLIAATGETEDLDTTSLASLTAGNIAATGGMAKLLGEKEFSILFHEGARDNIHISIIGQRVILVVIFDQRSSLGLVRLRVKKSAEMLGSIFNQLLQKVETEKGSGKSGGSPFAEITDEDIDKLFG
jgi:predicted regulator of Ras-like GTPase activity (Roadblock/LC7/MglB family)